MIRQCFLLHFTFDRIIFSDSENNNLSKDYYARKPFHSLRHIAAQVWLDKSDYDYGFVAELLGWTTIDELKTSYGGISGERFARKYQKYIHGSEVSTDAKRAKDPSSDQSGE